MPIQITQENGSALASCSDRARQSRFPSVRSDSAPVRGLRFTDTALLEAGATELEAVAADADAACHKGFAEHFERRETVFEQRVRD